MRTPPVTRAPDSKAAVTAAGVTSQLPASANPVASAPHEAAPNRAVSNGAADPAASPGFLMIKTSPPFAQVSIDGKPSESTPFKAPLSLAAGAHELLLEREGCLPLHVPVKISPTETTFLRLTLERTPSAQASQP